MDIALGLPTQGTFQYSVPEHINQDLQVGQRVFVSVRSRRLVGHIVGLSAQKAVPTVRDIDAGIDKERIRTDKLLSLTQWMADYYFCSWGQAIEAALPAPFKKGKFLMKSRQGARELLNHGSSIPFQLTPDQKKAFDVVSAKMKAKEYARFLLYGITGSGKTEVYMALIAELLTRSRGSIVLVPEISLTPQAVERFYSRFGNCVAVIHSRLTQAKRVEEWHCIQSGQAKVVVGARSAIFSPVKDLGLIVIDEEHESSYKQEETPRYHTRDVAQKRAELESAVLLLGSATPSLESFYQAQKNSESLLNLPVRIENRPLPRVEIVDMRREEKTKMAVFSKALEQAVRDSLAKGEQVMLLLNRRGFSTYLHCASCGYVLTCPNCRISLTYHSDKRAVFCHVCHHRAAPDKLCPGCQKHYLHYFGMGTQKVEHDAGLLFPHAKIFRMDSDSTTKRDSHEKILEAFKKKEIDILIGTQMIAKGHDFPNVSLIGVVSADTALHVPDFRSSEKTFDLLTQVAGRAGRGDVPGKVIMQTFVPNHYAIQNAQSHDYLRFYSKEIALRNELMLPPFGHLIQFILSGPDEKEVLRQITGFKKQLILESGAGVYRVLGPAPCLISKERGQFRWNIFFAGPDIASMNVILKKALKKVKWLKVRLIVDVDPE